MKSEFAALLEQCLQEKADVIPDGFHTVEQWAEKEGLSRPQMHRWLREFAAKGKAEVKAFRIAYPSIGLRNVPHYRLLAETSQKAA